jgi:SPX domain protein involved in polyphosphate accumulation
MRFGQLLDEQAYAPWKEHYFTYNDFKARMKLPAVERFSETLVEEVRRVEEFSRAQKEELARALGDLEKRWQNVLGWKMSGFPDVEAHVEALHNDLVQLASNTDRLLDFMCVPGVGARAAR